MNKKEQYEFVQKKYVEYKQAHNNASNNAANFLFEQIENKAYSTYKRLSPSLRILAHNELEKGNINQTDFNNFISQDILKKKSNSSPDKIDIPSFIEDYVTSNKKQYDSTLVFLMIPFLNELSFKDIINVKFKDIELDLSGKYDNIHWELDSHIYNYTFKIYGKLYSEIFNKCFKDKAQEEFCFDMFYINSDTKEFNYYKASSMFYDVLKFFVKGSISRNKMMSSFKVSLNSNYQNII